MEPSVRTIRWLAAALLLFVKVKSNRRRRYWDSRSPFYCDASMPRSQMAASVMRMDFWGCVAARETRMDWIQ
ncbi:hypothetical protein Y886_39795 [Xanthomonas hyacinthi DSM 19077]|nr:hypothetical protein Y886_39795 [Xanthomonas hyacinthi DSM 19077]